MATKLLAYILAVMLAPGLAIAAPITSLYVVGDSLADQGNGFLLTGGAFPPLPYDQRASNGPVAVEYLANALGVPLAPSEAGGTNYAVLGAATGPVGIPSLPPLTTENSAALLYGQPALEGTSLLSQTSEILATGPLGILTHCFSCGEGQTTFSSIRVQRQSANAVNNLAVVISMLYGGGARQFLIPNLPDLSRTPSGLSLTPDQSAGLQALTLGFNAGLAGALGGLSASPRYRHRAVRHLRPVQRDSGQPRCVRLQQHHAPCITGDLQVGGSFARTQDRTCSGTQCTRPPPRTRCSAMPSPLQWQNRSRNRPPLLCSASA